MAVIVAITAVRPVATAAALPCIAPVRASFASPGTLWSSIGAIYFEEVRRHIGTDAAQLYGGFPARLTAWCEQHAIPYEGVPVGRIKHHVAGKGNADKSAVIATIRARVFSPADGNEADALAILLWAIETRGGAS